jgi:ubiquinone/menaquinone biosynthesis C-methylase UbiE
MIDDRLIDTQQAFDSVASAYDGPIGNNALIQRMRRQLWRAVERELPAGSRLLDLGCGTGLDAAHLAERGYHVVATDWSTSMVERTRARVAERGLNQLVETLAVGMHQLDRLEDEQFDGIFTDLGAVNCVPDLGAAARGCARLLRPGGRLIASVIGRRCPWEVAYYLLRGKPTRARLRFTPGVVPVGLNGHQVWTRYYAPREFYAAFAPDFTLTWYRGLSWLLPPPYLIHWYERLKPLFRPLGWLDDRLGALPIARDLGDHFLIVMTRRDRGR